MDTSDGKIDVEAKVAEIKAHMPEVYKQIRARAGEIGQVAFAQVRRGLRGQPNCFYAMERGRVVGTPFDQTDIMDVVAASMVRFGSAHVCIFGEAVNGQD